LLNNLPHEHHAKSNIPRYGIAYIGDVLWNIKASDDGGQYLLGKPKKSFEVLPCMGGYEVLQRHFLPKFLIPMIVVGWQNVTRKIEHGHKVSLV
jgi:hypothetical protein